MRSTVKGDYINVELTGRFALAKGVKELREIAKSCERHHCSKILMDVTSMKGEIGTVERFEAAKSASSILDKNCRIAIVARLDQILPSKVFENAAVTRGVQTRVFTDTGEALMWLDAQPQDSALPTPQEATEKSVTGR